MATRIIVEIDGKEVAATTIHPDPSPGIAEGVDVPAVPASLSRRPNCLPAPGPSGLRARDRPPASPERQPAASWPSILHGWSG